MNEETKEQSGIIQETGNCGFFMSLLKQQRKKKNKSLVIFAMTEAHTDQVRILGHTKI